MCIELSLSTGLGNSRSQQEARLRLSLRRSSQTVLLRTSSKTSKNLEMSSRFHFRQGSIPPIGPRPRSDEHAKCTDRSSDKSQEEGSPSIHTRAQLMRPRLQSPAGRRNSSAESPGPSNSPSVLANHLALQPSVQLLHGSHQHNRLQRQHDF